MRLDKALAKERTEQRQAREDNWTGKLESLETTAVALMERRLACLSEDEERLDAAAREDAGAYVAVKHAMEDDIRVLTDQLYSMGSLHQLNEVGNITGRARVVNDT